MGEKYIFYKPEKSLFRKVVEKATPLIVAGGIALGAMEKGEEKEKPKSQETIKDIVQYEQELGDAFKGEDFLTRETKQSLSSLYSKDNEEKVLADLEKTRNESMDKMYKRLFADKESYANKYFKKVLEDQDYREELLVTVMDAAQKYNVPYDVAMGMLAVESGGDPSAKSKKDALGIFQIMPKTGEIYKMKIDKDFPENDDRSDIAKNADAAMHIISDYHKTFGAWSLALVAYNEGPNALEKQIGKLYNLPMKDGYVVKDSWKMYNDKLEEGEISFAKLLNQKINNNELKSLDGFQYVLKAQALAKEMGNIFVSKQVAFKQDFIQNTNIF